ncbi:hypothetical protein TNCT_667251 [Trichonephila clavata]|uniref:Uncharacterized protein n=1 Tax=Trichonephila clavata TaxID=2740835 RepID=A0A8X6LDD7_TRICU|nr:hypothetical protein TNCT_667251 [Trichonephila clavata]
MPPHPSKGHKSNVLSGWVVGLVLRRSQSPSVIFSPYRAVNLIHTDCDAHVHEQTFDTVVFSFIGISLFVSLPSSVAAFASCISASS